MKQITAFGSIGGATDWFYKRDDGHSYHCTNPYSLKFYGERFNQKYDNIIKIDAPRLERFFKLNGWEFDSKSFYSKDPAHQLYPLYVYVDRTGGAGEASAFESFDKVFGMHYVCPNKMYIPYSVAKEAFEHDKILNVKLEFRSHGNWETGNECETFQCILHLISDLEQLPEKI